MCGMSDPPWDAPLKPAQSIYITQGKASFALAVFCCFAAITHLFKLRTIMTKPTGIKPNDLAPHFQTILRPFYSTSSSLFTTNWHVSLTDQLTLNQIPSLRQFFRQDAVILAWCVRHMVNLCRNQIVRLSLWTLTHTLQSNDPPRQSANSLNCQTVLMELMQQKS